METSKGNRLIAEFMGKTVYPVQGTAEYKKWKGKAHDYQWFQLKYDSSWDWLMPVVQNILATDDQGLNLYILYVSDALRTADIKQVWEAVINCIESFKPVTNA